MAGSSLHGTEASELCYAGSEDQSQCADKYDAAITVMEEAFFCDEFQSFQQRFFDEHCDEFTDCEENRLCYTEVFQQYVNHVEDFIGERLRRIIRNFDMNRFVHWLETHREEVQGDLPDIVDCVTDFVSFKTAMLENKRRCGQNCDLSILPNRV